MQDAQQALKVGCDPRMLPEYERLRAEINKLSHASRPKVDWELVHRMAGIIFEKQGVDLQTAVYFVLARSRLQGLSGFTEGCEFLANLIVTQWDNFWPPMHQERARTEMLDWFIARISEVIRQYTISHEDKRLIYRCERALQLLNEKLHNVGLSRVPRVENLTHFIEGYTHLFDEPEIVIVSDEQELSRQDMQIPPMVFFKSEMDGDAPDAPHALPKGGMLVGKEKEQLKPAVLKIEAHRKQRPAWFWFACGLLSCALPVAAVNGWQYWRAQELSGRNDAIALLKNPAEAMPAALSFNDLRQVRTGLGEQALREMESDVITHYQAQLARVQQASPVYFYQYGDDLKNSLRILYPDSLAVKAMDAQWQAALDAQQGEKRGEAAYLAARNGVNDLLKQLLELERQRKTVTISYLKSQLYEIQKSMAVDQPFGVRLSALEARKVAQGAIGPHELNGMIDELKSLNARLYQLQRTNAGN